MAYIINRFDGTQLAIIEDGQLDTSTPIGLIGRNYTGYGEVQNENLIYILENFANQSPPTKALRGQAWYDTQNRSLKIYNGTDWLNIGNATVNDVEPGHSVGGLWLKNSTQQLYISDGTTWRLVGPEGVEGFSVTKLTSTKIKDVAGTFRPVIFSYVNGEVTAIITAVDFQISGENPVDGFSRLYKGVNIKPGFEFIGNLKGSAESASKLTTARKINNVNFDGSQDITVTASTTKPLKSGDFIIGSDFDGSFDTEWNIDASPQNFPGKIVSRDSTGGFSASTINADLFGNVNGNVTSTSGFSSFDEVRANTFVGNTFSGVANRALRLNSVRTINGVNFDGTENIVIPINSNELIGSRLANNVVESSLRTLGKLISLDIEPAGVQIGDGNDMSVFVDGFTPTIQADTTDILRLRLLTGSASSTPTTITFVNHSAGGGSPALVPDYNLGTAIDQRPSLGTASNKWKNVYAKNLNAENTYTTNLNGPGNQVLVSNDLVVQGTTYGNLTGNVTGTLTGTVIGSVSGAASLNMLKTGDAMSGNLAFNFSGNGITWAMNTDSASIKFYNSGDGDSSSRLEFQTSDNGNEYFSWTHLPSGGSAYESMRLTPVSPGNANLTIYGNVSVNGDVISSAAFRGSGTALDINADRLVTGTVPVSRLSGTYNINIGGNAATATTAQVATGNIQRTGDTMTGRLGQHTSGFHAATIQNITARTNSGFFDTDSATTGEGWPVTTNTWYHLLSSTHVNDGNYYAMQLSADFYSQNLYYRSTAGNGATAWSRILHSGNYNDYAPTKTGGGASGTWPINVTGNAGTVTTITSAQITSALGYTPVNPNTLSNTAGSSLSGTTGTFSGKLTVAAGSGNGIHWPADSFGGGGDTARITLESAGGEATRMRFTMTNDGDDYFEFSAPNSNGLTMNGNTVLHAGNYNSYAPTKTGGGASGTWDISISGQAATVGTITSTQIRTALGFTPADSATVASALSGTLSADSGSFTGPLTVAAGISKGIRWPNDSYGGSGDTARITLESAGGEATRLRFTVTNDADDMIEFNVPTISGVKINSWTVLNDGNFTATYGNTVYSINGYTNQVGSWNDSRNYFDVYPPAGYTMANLLAFMPSIAVIHYAGGVNGDDSMRCTWSNLGDRIRVWVQNTEQRSTPAGNWIAFWRK